MRQARVVESAELASRAARVRIHHRHVVRAERDVQRGRDYRVAGAGREHVEGAEHQLARLHYRLARKRDVNRHLVAVKVGVEGGAYQRMQLYGAAVYQHRLERLYAKPVQRGRAVEQNGADAHHFL